MHAIAIARQSLWPVAVDAAPTSAEALASANCALGLRGHLWGELVPARPAAARRTATCNPLAARNAVTHCAIPSDRGRRSFFDRLRSRLLGEDLPHLGVVVVDQESSNVALLSGGDHADFGCDEARLNILDAGRADLALEVPFQ